MTKLSSINIAPYDQYIAPYDQSLSSLTTASIRPLKMSDITALGSNGLTVSTGAHGLSTPWSNPGQSLVLSQHVKQYKINESTEDVLALSVTWKRIRSGRPAVNAVISSLTDSELFSYISEEDRVEATVIRDYYKKKLVFWTLKEVKLSQFRLDMSKFLHADGKLFADNMLPLVYRLPEFYEYDIGFTDMMRDLEQHDTSGFKTQPHNLRPMRKFRVKRSTEYWFKDEHDRAVTILLENTNPCKSLFEREFKKESMNMIITGVVTTRDSYSYFKVNKWEVE